jgi:hypothetical protein
MKKVIFIISAILFTAFYASASDPVIEDKCCPIVVSSPYVDFAYDENVYSKFFAPAYFNDKTNSLHLKHFKK